MRMHNGTQKHYLCAVQFAFYAQVFEYEPKIAPLALMRGADS